MAAALRVQTKKPIREKDLHNLKARLDRNVNPGPTEGDNLRRLLEEIQQKDPATFIYIETPDTKSTQCIVLITSEMKAFFRENPEILFIDATYRVNKQNYAMYLALVQDGNGISQVVAACWVASEREGNIRTFLQQFKLAHGEWNRLRVIMLDKDFVELKLTHEEFPNASTLLCIFHVIKAVKTRIARTDLLVPYKQEILTAFRHSLYTYTKSAFETVWKELIEECPDELKEYFKENWKPIADKWVMYHRKHLPTLGNTTNNRMERFNLQYKQVMRDRKRTVPHITECVRILVDLLDTKTSRTSFIQFLQNTTHMNVYFSEYQEFFDVAGMTLTDFAVQLVHKEMKRFHLKKEHLRVTSWGDDLYSVTNELHGKDYQVLLSPEGGCECTFNCTLAIACSHIFAVRLSISNSRALFDRSDYHKRWLRNSSESKEPFPVYREFISRILDEEHENISDNDDDDDAEVPAAKNLLQEKKPRGRPRLKQTLLNFNNTQHSKVAKTGLKRVNVEDREDMSAKRIKKVLQPPKKAAAQSENANIDATEDIVYVGQSQASVPRVHGARPPADPQQRERRPRDKRTGIILPSVNNEILLKTQASWKEHLGLSARENFLVFTDEGLLNSSLVDAGVFLLRKLAQEKQISIGGLDYVWDMQTDPGNNSFMQHKRAVQVIFTPGHWQVLTRVDRHLNFYCSLHWDMTAETKRLLAILSQHKRGSVIRVEKRSVQKQTGYTDCGLFALAIATEFVLGNDPSEARFHQPSMRKHFQDCLVAERMEGVFPPAPRQRSGKHQKTVFEVGKSELVEFRAPKWWLLPSLEGATQRMTRSNKQ